MSQTQSPFATAKTARELFGHGPISGGTRERLMDVAMDLFYAHGIHAVGIDQIIGAVGVTKTTFYNHFESKDELVLEVLRRRDRFEAEAWVREVDRRAGDDPRAKLLAIFDVLHAWFTNPAFKGCQFINAAHEFPSPHDPVHRATAEHAEHTLAWLEGLADQAGSDDPQGLAAQLAVLLDGAITMRLVSQNDDAAAIARAAAQTLLDTHVPI
jgi:AcrR family transcriptional regulator